MRYNRTMNLRIDEDLRNLVRRVSTELNITESDMIRNQLTAFCSQWEQQKRHDQLMQGFEAY
jgi:antitoxin component of RelBE/YafQ-DinJ toxin-antitoxin module